MLKLLSFLCSSLLFSQISTAIVVARSSLPEKAPVIETVSMTDAANTTLQTKKPLSLVTGILLLKRIRIGF